MAIGWIPSLAFVALFSFLFVRDYRFWREMKKWGSVERMKSVLAIEDGKAVDMRTRDPRYAKDFKHKYDGGGALLEIAEHNLITSIIGWIVSAGIMTLDVYLTVVGG
jgi:hypothetical protein